MNQKNFSIRYAWAELGSTYCKSHTHSDSKGNTLKYTLDEAREEAHKMLDKYTMDSDDSKRFNHYVKYCKIYNGREFIEDVIR